MLGLFAGKGEGEEAKKGEEGKGETEDGRSTNKDSKPSEHNA